MYPLGKHEQRQPAVHRLNPLAAAFISSGPAQHASQGHSIDEPLEFVEAAKIIATIHIPVEYHATVHDARDRLPEHIFKETHSAICKRIDETQGRIHLGFDKIGKAVSKRVERLIYKFRKSVQAFEIAEKVNCGLKACKSAFEDRILGAKRNSEANTPEARMSPPTVSPPTVSPPTVSPPTVSPPTVSPSVGSPSIASSLVVNSSEVSMSTPVEPASESHAYSEPYSSLKELVDDSVPDTVSNGSHRQARRPRPGMIWPPGVIGDKWPRSAKFPRSPWDHLTVARPMAPESEDCDLGQHELQTDEHIISLFRNIFSSETEDQ